MKFKDIKAGMFFEIANYFFYILVKGKDNLKVMIYYIEDNNIDVNTYNSYYWNNHTVFSDAFILHDDQKNQRRLITSIFGVESIYGF